MGRKFQYTTLDRILSKIYRDLGLEEISETDVVEWSGEALNFMDTPSLLEEAVAFIEVKNHHATLPNGLHSVIQVARNNHFVPEESSLCPASVIMDCVDCTEETVIPTSSCTDCGETTSKLVPVDCHGNPIFDDDELAYYRPYFDLQYEYYGWNQSNTYKQQYTPIRLANNTFFSSLVCPEEGEAFLGCNSTDEYTIAGDQIRTSFKDGSIAVAYHRQMVDQETGYPMIPDDVSFTTAITMYITMKYMSRLWYMGREGYVEKMKKSESDWHWYCKQAGNKAFTLYGVDEHQNLYDERNHLIPRHNRYYGFFGKLGTPENKNFKDPNGRNFRLTGV